MMNLFNSTIREEASASSYHNQQHKRPSSSTELVLMDSSTSDAMIEREHMFDKVVTPSDVGKLNRLVIPKQHAEKYFPLDSSSNDKGGLLLNFEDSNGKPWRFRYSYWNSSQSYVMTKGWSRFVKEKKLDAGDIVSFQRGAGELSKHRLFIDWRRRPHENINNQFMIPHQFSDGRIFPLQSYPTTFSRNLLVEGGSNYYNPSHSYYMYGIGNSSTSPYYSFNNNTSVAVNASPFDNNLMKSTAPQGYTSVVEPRVFNSVPVVQGKVTAKRFRLFGVNMDYPMPSEESSEKGKSSMSFDLDI